MSKDIIKLSDELKKALEYNPEIEIPEHISNNLSKDLREYQIVALKHYFLQRKAAKTNHLMFNMATGSGKTLIMAALILDLFKQGYNKFVFFVNSTAILEKTKSNFCDKNSSKYLFKEKIIINSQEVNINSITNFDEAKDKEINIFFSTIQGLFSLFNTPKENSLTLKDLENHKIVLIADEAHHLNTETKKMAKAKKNDESLDIKGWENIIKYAFNANAKNYMLEFTATIPQEKAIFDKYKDKIVFEYNLKNFSEEKFAKRIFLEQYGNLDIRQRFLGAMLTSIFREQIAYKYNIELKPVILFKSETIAQSKTNQELFKEFLNNLEEDDIIDFYKHLADENSIFTKIKEFFKAKYKDNFANKLVDLCKNAFRENTLLNVNNEGEKEKNQLKLNSLEDKDNEIRVIFAVNKLNEGWDVLNLFDIVRLADKKTSKETTTQEVQLIGRGARYFPFDDENGEEKYKRKFDNNPDELKSFLEILTYHSFNDVSFIKSLEEGLRNEGLLTDKDRKKIIIKPTERTKQILANKEFYFLSNKKIKFPEEFYYICSREEIEEEIKSMFVPYIEDKITESEIKYVENNIEKDFKKIKTLKEVLDYKIFQKALNQLNFGFNEISNFYNSKLDFYNAICKIKLNFHKNQKFNSAEVLLSIAKYIIKKYKTQKEIVKKDFKITDFKVYQLSQLGDRVIFKRDDELSNRNYEWLYYDKHSKDSNLEDEFLDFIESKKNELNQIFDEWLVIRNDGFNEFRIFDNRKNIKDKSNIINYGKGFEPDFIFFARKKGAENYLGIECFFEPKGEHLLLLDEWKQSLLVDELNEKSFNAVYNDKEMNLKDINFKVFAFPFFKANNNKDFEKAFNDFLASV